MVSSPQHLRKVPKAELVGDTAVLQAETMQRRLFEIPVSPAANGRPS
jgi:hypothetical protein